MSSLRIRLIAALASLVVLAGLAVRIVHLQQRVAPARYFAVFASLSLAVGIFVALTDPHVISRLREWASQSLFLAIVTPLSLLVPYLVYGFGTGTFSGGALLKLLACIAAPVVLLLPDRRHSPAKIGWRDGAAMLALAVPVATRWMTGIWTYPTELYFFRPIYSVCAGVYAFVVIRRLNGVGYRLLWRRDDLFNGFANFLRFAVVGIPLGVALHFIHFRLHPVSPVMLGVEFIGTYLTIAIPEELLFRGILQNLLEQSFSSHRKGLYALVIASSLFGAAHLHHPPVPNWRYALMATLAGLFYGNAFRKRHRIPASSLTHALVDTIWRAWF